MAQSEREKTITQLNQQISMGETKKVDITFVPKTVRDI